MRIQSLVLVSILASGCSSKGNAAANAEPTPSSAPAPTAAAAPSASPAAADIYAQRCVPCHGVQGGGDGPASASLNPRPRNFSDSAWQSSVDDEHIIKIIKFGGAAVGKSAAMPSNPDLTDPAVVAGLKDVVRSFKK